MAQVLIELLENGVYRRKFVHSDDVALWAEAGWAVHMGTPTNPGQATGFDAIVTDLVSNGASAARAAIDSRVTAVGNATYAPASGSSVYAPQSGTGSPAAALTTATGRAIAFAIALG